VYACDCGPFFPKPVFTRAAGDCETARGRSFHFWLKVKKHTMKATALFAVGSSSPSSMRLDFAKILPSCGMAQSNFIAPAPEECTVAKTYPSRFRKRHFG
jgi:hypothetical protein